jgi:hypothetical protein
MKLRYFWQGGSAITFREQNGDDISARNCAR